MSGNERQGGAPSGVAGRHVQHCLAEEDARFFLKANGLAQFGDAVVTETGALAGRLRVVRRGHERVWVLEMFEAFYTDGEGAEVKAWWPCYRPSFIMADETGRVLETGERLGPDLVVCDWCNRDVVMRPVPVVCGYAHCARCFAEARLAFPGAIRPYVPAIGDDVDAEVLEALKAITGRMQAPLEAPADREMRLYGG
jgi:hypothetical protein